MLKTEGEARGFQHFPADIKSVTSLLVPFLKQYQFSNKNQFKLKYEGGVFRDIAVRRFKEVLKTEGEASVENRWRSPRFSTLPCRH